jgi:hypothetical protein
LQSLAGKLAPVDWNQQRVTTCESRHAVNVCMLVVYVCLCVCVFFFVYDSIEQ